MSCEDPSMDFRCPISMEIMEDPVTIITGVTYDRKNIEKWFHTYNKHTCPATMQSIKMLETTPNHTLKRLITAWRADRIPCTPLPLPSSKHDELEAVLDAIEMTPFKESCIRKLRSIVVIGEEFKEDFRRSGGVEILVGIIEQILVESSDFVAFRACEEAFGVLDLIPVSDEEDRLIKALMSPNCMKAMGIMLQRGSAEARLCTISIFLKLAKADYQWNFTAGNQGIEFFKSLLEIASDEISTKASSSALLLLINVMDASKKSRLQAIEAGGVRTLIELLPDSSRTRCEKIMQLLKLLCECAEGRLAFTDHELGIAAVSKKILNVSAGSTKVAVKILWLISSFHSTARVVEEMLACGAAKKLVALLNIGGGQSTTKERVVKILKLHAPTWRRYSCFPADVREYLGLDNDTRYKERE